MNCFKHIQDFFWTTEDFDFLQLVLSYWTFFESIIFERTSYNSNIYLPTKNLTIKESKNSRITIFLILGFF